MRVNINGVGVEYQVTGEGPPVVLLHGFPDSGRLWRHQVPALAEAGFKVIVPDMRGYGRSDKPEEVDAYTMELLVGDVLAVISAVGAERAHVVGHDWGAAVAWAIASVAADAVIAELEANDSLTPGLNYYRANIPPEVFVRPGLELPPVQAPTMGV